MSENETLNQTSVNESLTRNKKVKNEEDALLKKSIKNVFVIRFKN
ncbi:hypothetical protein [Globicatella sp. PHS-GS-PNBC-21-1553]|nr:hypothetical protein [Globicatella sp. PHS-GS-PNBC-21-1553]